jgi:hypothetical protein
MPERGTTGTRNRQLNLIKMPAWAWQATWDIADGVATVLLRCPYKWVLGTRKPSFRQPATAAGQVDLQP